MDAKPGHDERILRNSDRPQNCLRKKIPLCFEWADKFSIGVSIHAKRLAGLLDGVVQDCGAAIVKRMGERVGRMNPLKTVLVQRQCPQERRSDCHRMHGGTYVVQETGQRQFTRARSTTDAFLCFQHEDGSAGASKNDRGSQSIRAGADDDAIVFASSRQGVALSYDGGAHGGQRWILGELSGHGALLAEVDSLVVIFATYLDVTKMFTASLSIVVANRVARALAAPFQGELNGDNGNEPSMVTRNVDLSASLWRAMWVP